MTQSRRLTGLVLETFGMNNEASECWSGLVLRGDLNPGWGRRTDGDFVVGLLL